MYNKKYKYKNYEVYVGNRWGGGAFLKKALVSPDKSYIGVGAFEWGAPHWKTEVML